MSTTNTSTDGAPTHPVAEDTLRSLPPSAKLVLKVMEREPGRHTLSTLETETRLPRRTIRDAVDRLQTIDVVERRPNLRDARQSIYTITTES